MGLLAIAGVGAVATVGGALISSSAANNASNQASQAAAANNALQQQIYNSNVQLATPYINLGTSAGSELSGFLGIGGDPAKSSAALNTYLNSTGYQFNKTEGVNAITGSKAASGLLDSGSTLKALYTFGTGLADSYGQQYAGNLQNLVDTGQRSAGSLTGAGQAYANAVGSNNNNAATVSANAGLANAANINGLIGNAFNAFGALRGASSFGGGSSSSSAGNAFGGSWAGGG